MQRKDCTFQYYFVLQTLHHVTDFSERDHSHFLSCFDTGLFLDVDQASSKLDLQLKEMQDNINLHQSALGLNVDVIEDGCLCFVFTYIDERDHSAEFKVTVATSNKQFKGTLLFIIALLFTMLSFNNPISNPTMIYIFYTAYLRDALQL